MNELFSGQNIDDAFTILIRLEEFTQLQSWLAEELVRALIFQTQQGPLDRTTRLRGHIAILTGYLFTLLIH